jgi:alpha-methylacyl-CoA racemase
MANQELTSGDRHGPLAGLKVVEFAGLGPGPFACMLLSDLGADVVTIAKPGTKAGDPANITGRGRTVVIADLKDSDAREDIYALLARADILVEGFRPGVMERLGFGPDTLEAINPRLIYGRVTGWGQSGPLAQSAGHDINYIALAGALHAIGTANGPPVPPLNLVGDYGGGSLYLVCGILAALHERQFSGRGQTIDAAIVDGTLSLMSTFLSFQLRGEVNEQRGTNMLDGGAPFYGVYETADGKHVSIGAIEPQFFALLCESVGISESLRSAHHDRGAWPALHEELRERFLQKSRAQWCDLLEGTDCCFAPVLSMSESGYHPHNEARHAMVSVDGVLHPAPAPRFSRTPSTIHGSAPKTVTRLADVLGRWS